MPVDSRPFQSMPVGTKGDLQFDQGSNLIKVGITSQILRWDGNIYPAGGNSNIFGIFTPKTGEMIQFDEYFHLAHVFLDVFCRCFGSQTDPMNSDLLQKELY